MRSLRGAIGLVTVLAVWQALAGAELINPVLMPSPRRLVDAIIELLADGSLLTHVTASLERVFTGFVLAALCGMSFGVETLDGAPIRKYANVAGRTSRLNWGFLCERGTVRTSTRN